MLVVGRGVRLALFGVLYKGNLSITGPIHRESTGS